MIPKKEQLSVPIAISSVTITLRNTKWDLHKMVLSTSTVYSL
jgi:hypothetical protein